MDLARSWLGDERVLAPLKCLDRLLGNRALHLERRLFHALICRWLSRSNQMLVLVDWSDLKRDGSWHLFRAAVPVGGRSVTMYKTVYPKAEKATPHGHCRAARRGVVLPNQDEVMNSQIVARCRLVPGEGFPQLFV